MGENCIGNSGAKRECAAPLANPGLSRAPNPAGRVSRGRTQSCFKSGTRETQNLTTHGRFASVLFGIVACVTAALATVQASMAAEASPCADAIARAEQQAALPASLLGAIALVESGRPDATGTVRPWPWTVNAEGHGRFYAFKQDAVAAVRELQARGIRSIDVGCLQVNLQHHPAAFPSLEQAFDPAVNAGYAARFLTELFAETGSWSSAVAWYHSRTPETGAGYRQLVSRAGSSGGTAPGFGADASPYRPGFLRERNAAERELARHRAAAAASRLAVAPAVGKAMYAQGGSVARAHGAGP